MDKEMANQRGTAAAGPDGQPGQPRPPGPRSARGPRVIARIEPLTWARKAGRTCGLAAVLLIVLVIANIVAIPGFLSGAAYLALLAAGLAPIAIAAVASTPSILSGGGGVDISIGPLVGLINIVLTTELIPHGLSSPWLAIPLLLGLGTLVGTVSGIAVARLRYQPVIATVCVFFILNGVNLSLAPTPVSAPSNWTWTLSDHLGRLPVGLLTIAAPILVWIGLRRTPFVRTLLAVGGNDAAALSAGVNVASVRTAAYALGGLFAAMGGIAMAAVFRSADATTPMQYTLIALAAVALGGTPLTGGRGGVIGSAIGAAVIYMIQNLLAALHVSNDLLPAIYGALLIIAIVLASRIDGVKPAVPASLIPRLSRR
jgi:ribose transport system permease protein